MSLTQRQLRTLLLIAEKGSISRAAVDLSMSQPAVSRMLGQIEQNLAVKLFDRSGRGVHTTEAGRRVIEHAAEIMRRYELIGDSIAELENQLAGSVCVILPEAVGNVLFIPLIKHFKKHFPYVSMRVMVAKSRNIPHHLQNGAADIGVVDINGVKNLNTTPLMREQFYLIGPFSQRTSKVIALSDVARLPLVLTVLEGSIRTFIDRVFAEKNDKPNIVYEVDSATAMVELVRQGEGYTIMPYAMVYQAVQRRELTAQLITDPEIERVFWTVLPSNRPGSRLMRVAEEELVKLAHLHMNTARWLPLES